MKLSALFAVWLSVATAGAHEIGTSRVRVALHEGRTYEIEIITAAASLAEKLGASADLREDGIDARFRKRVKVVFDGSEVAPAAAYSVTAGTATIRLSGDVPQGATRFSWSYGWTFASYALTVKNDGAAITTQWLEGNQCSAPVPLKFPASPATRWPTVLRYLRLGFTHIVPNGVDHILFVLGIFLLGGRARTIFLQVSAFTVAHSITLGLSLYGIVAVSPKIVEPMIAVSIAYVAIENILLRELKSWRVALVFVFGLLHGMGFAGALKDLGLPRSEFLTALMTFNVGVETGQLTVIGAAFLAAGWQCARKGWYRSRVVIPASALIACTAIYWTIERLWS
jgi:hydrogenase/urease accessory protein HupE